MLALKNVGYNFIQWLVTYIYVKFQYLLKYMYMGTWQGMKAGHFFSNLLPNNLHPQGGTWISYQIPNSFTRN